MKKIKRNEKPKSYLREEHIFIKKLVHALRPLKYLHTSQIPSNQEELHKAFIYTIKIHSLKKELEGYYLKGAFWELAKYDQINTHKNRPYLVKLNQLFEHLKTHLKMKEHIINAKAFSTIRTSYSTHDNFVKPVTNAYNIALEDNQNSIDLQNKLKILNGFKKHPLTFSLAIQYADNPEYDFLYEDINKKDFLDMQGRIASSKLKLSLKDIAKSLQVYILSTYHKDSIYNRLLKNSTPIPNKKLVQYVGEISQKFIDSNTAIPNVKNIDCQVKILDFQEGIPILQPTTKKSKKKNLINSYEDIINNPEWIF